MPKENSYEWYHCNDEAWLAPLVAVLLSKRHGTEHVGMFSFGPALFAVFIMDGCLYYAPYSNSWDSVEDIEEYIGDDCYFTGVSETISASHRKYSFTPCYPRSGVSRLYRNLTDTIGGWTRRGRSKTL